MHCLLLDIIVRNTFSAMSHIFLVCEDFWDFSVIEEPVIEAHCMKIAH